MPLAGGQRSVFTAATLTAIELLLSDGNASDTVDSGVIDWFHDAALFNSANPLLNFSGHIVDHATSQNYTNSLARPEVSTQRGLKWQTEEAEKNYKNKFCAIVYWGRFIQCENFPGMLPSDPSNCG